MKYPHAWITMGLVVILLSGCAEHRQCHHHDHQSVDSTAEDAGYYQYWETHVPLPEGDAVEDSFLIDDNLYITTTQGNLHAIQVKQGLLRWSAKVSEPHYRIYRPSHFTLADGRDAAMVFTTSDLMVLDRYSGDRLFITTLPFAPGGPPIADGKHVYAGSADGNIYSIIWRHDYGNAAITAWKAMVGSPAKARPAMKAGLLYFATLGGKVIACSALDKTYVWHFNTNGPIVADPFVTDTAVYVASTDRSLYRLSLATGEQQWRVRYPEPLEDPPIVYGFNVYQHSHTRGMTAIDAESGTEAWTCGEARWFLAAHHGDVAMLTADGMVHLYNNQTGAVTSSFNGGDVVTAPVNLTNDAVYLVHADGTVSCHRASEVPYLRKQEMEAAQALLAVQPSTIPPKRNQAAKAEKRKRQEDPLRSERDQ